MSDSLLNASIQAHATQEAARESTAAHLHYANAIRQQNADRLAKCIEEFAIFDESSLIRKTDKELAHFQAQYPPEAPQCTLAQNEWNRRLVTRQVKATRFAAVIGLIGIIVGVILGWFLAAHPAPHIPNHQSHSKPSSQSSEAIRQPANGAPIPSM